MGEILLRLRQNETLIYLLLGGVVLFSVIKLLSVWRDWKSANFGLEKELTQRKASSTLTILLICVLLALAEFVLVSFVSPGLSNPRALATQTIDLMAVAPTKTSQPITPTSLDLVNVQPTATTSIASNGCQAGLLEWTYPVSGEKIKGTITLQGTVNFVNLGFYKYEYSQVGSDIWNPIAAGDSKIIKGDLGGPWNTTELIPGEYRLRLVATDNNNNPFPTCEITITVLQVDD